MCGIVGVLQYESKVPREIRQKALKILFSEAMLKTEVRGEDATGIYQVHQMRDGEDYGDWAMTKKGIKASEWLFQDGATSEDPVVYSDFMDSWLEHPKELTALVGHCRKATVGSKGRDNDDNHPFAIQLDERNAILGIHNGTLNNHELIFKNLPGLLKRQGQVDSEAIFHLMYHLSEHGTKPWDAEMMKTLGKRLDGAAACIVVNTRFPHLVATWRVARPMEYFLIAPLNIVIICSEKKFVDSALEKYEFIRRMLDPQLPKLEKYDTSLTEKDFRIFDTSKPWPAGSPGFKDMNEISERGDMKPYNVPLEAGWFTPSTTTTPATGTGTGTTYGTTGGYSGAKATGATSSALALSAGAAKTTKYHGTGAAKATPATDDKKDDDEVSIVEVEIGSQEEAERATEKAKSLGICTHYDSEQEVAKTIGLSPLELDKLPKLDLANALAKAHFNFGYAVSRFDTKTEVEKTRKKGRELTKRLEKAEEKKKRSGNRIWELKQLITLMLALNDSNYSISEQNIGVSLSAFADLGEERRKDIMAQAKDILGDKHVMKVVGQLRTRYKEAKQRKQKRREKEVSSEG